MPKFEIHFQTKTHSPENEADDPPERSIFHECRDFETAQIWAQEEANRMIAQNENARIVEVIRIKQIREK